MTNKYRSRYSPNKLVTAGQYILELICEKRAQYLGRDLPIQFWKLPEWATYFQSQTRKCHKLLTKYHPDSIILALKDKRAYKIYSLHAPWLISIIEEYNIKVLAGNKSMLNSKPEQLADTSKINDRPQFVKSNMINKLQNIE